MKPRFACLSRLFLLLLLSCMGFEMGAADTWETERDSLLENIQGLLMRGDLVAGEEKLLNLQARSIVEVDTPVIIKCYIGIINIHIDDWEVLDSLLTELEPLVKAKGSPVDFIEFYLDKAKSYNLIGNYNNQIVYLDSALTWAQQEQDSLNMGFTYHELSIAYQNANNFESALEMNQRAQAQFKGLGLTFYVGYTLRNEANIYITQKAYPKALEVLLHSESAFKEAGHSDNQAFSMAVRGNVYLEIGKDQLALSILEQAKKELFGRANKEDNEVAYGQVYEWLAKAYQASGQKAKALKTANTYMQLCLDHGHAQNRLSALQTLINLQLGDKPQVQEQFREFIELQDELVDERTSRTILEFERKYKAKEAEKKVLESQKIAQEAEIRAQNNRFFVFLVLALALLAGLILTLVTVRARYRTQKQINDLNRKALQLQIQPHFFFNVLNGINHYITENDQKAASFYLARFAKLMRLSLENSRHDRVEFGQEMDLLEAYLHLEQLRRDRFDFTVDIPDSLRDKKIPPLMVQPFVENAVVHAFPDEIPHRGEVKVTARLDKETLEVEISDNGIGIPNSSQESHEKGKTSLAIRILEERLTAYGRRKGSIHFEKLYPQQESYPGTRVLLRIPLS